MAVINCPKCKKKISDKAQTCSHCDAPLGKLDNERLASIRKLNKVTKMQTLMNYSFIAMLFFCGGFLYFYRQNVQPGTTEYFLSIGSAVLGFICYIAIRVRLLMIKRQH